MTTTAPRSLIVSCVLVLAAAMALALPALAFAASDGSEFKIVAHRDIDYIAGEDYADNKDTLDVFMPEGATNAPVVVYFHGGALQNGTKAIGEGLAHQLAARGVGLVTANYRLSPSVMHPAHMEDATAAFVWTKRHIGTYGGDPNRVFVSGHSAGAYLAALMALDPSYLAAHNMQLSDIRGAIPISPLPLRRRPGRRAEPPEDRLGHQRAGLARGLGHAVYWRQQAADAVHLRGRRRRLAPRAEPATRLGAHSGRQLGRRDPDLRPHARKRQLQDG